MLVESQLCDLCSVLRLDDEQHGGYALSNSSGHPVLAFGDNEEDMTFELNYRQTDSLPHLPKLKVSGDAGCAFCHALRDATLTLALEEWDKVRFELRYAWHRGVHELGSKLLLVNLSSVDDDFAETGQHSNLVFQVDCKKGALMLWLRANESPREATLCAGNIAWIKAELNRCDEHGCTGALSQLLPTRLLDLGDSGTTEDVRLVSTEKLSHSSVRYATLSYCWGNREEAAHQLKTKLSVLKQHYDAIPLTKVTRVIQDAIITARALSIRYLWVDALCIVQDDMRDWERESRQMGMIYGNAYVTFCTPTTSSCLESFLVRPPAINVNFQSQVQSDISGVLSLRHQRMDTKFELSYDCDTSPWFLDQHWVGSWIHRCWTLQEQHLSTRRLYFGLFHIYIHCSKRESTEPGIYASQWGTFRDQVLDYEQHQSFQKLLECWELLIQDFTERSITNVTDKMAAISGLAEVMSVGANVNYLSGLWMEDLPRGLLWKSSNPRDTLEFLIDRTSKTPSSPYIGPSWSWVPGNHIYEAPWITPDDITINLGNESKETRFTIQETQYQSQCEIISACCTPYDMEGHRYGRLKHAEIHLEAKLQKCPTTWKRDHPRGWFNAHSERWTSINSNMIVSCAIDFAVPQETNELRLENMYMLLLASSHGRNSRWPDGVCSEEAVVPTTTQASESISNGTFITGVGENSSRTQRNAWGLLVCRVEDVNTFCRIGVFRVAARNKGLSVFDEVLTTSVKII